MILTTAVGKIQNCNIVTQTAFNFTKCAFKLELLPLNISYEPS